MIGSFLTGIASPGSDPMPPMPKKKIDPREIAAGTRHEMEHTKDRKVARQIALDHLKEHPLYYRILPMAEQMMSLEEQKRRPVPHKHRRRPPAPVPFWQTLPPNWG